MVSAAASAGASVASDAAHAFLLPHLPYHEKYGNAEAIALAGGVGGLGHLAMLQSMDGRLLSQGPVAQFIGVGVLAEVAGGAVFHNVVQPMCNAVAI